MTVFDYSKLFTYFIFYFVHMFRFPHNTTTVHITNHYYFGFIFLRILKNMHGSTFICVKHKPLGLNMYQQKLTKYSRAALTHPCIPHVSFKQSLLYFLDSWNQVLPFPLLNWCIPLSLIFLQGTLLPHQLTNISNFIHQYRAQWIFYFVMWLL